MHLLAFENGTDMYKYLLKHWIWAIPYKSFDAFDKLKSAILNLKSMALHISLPSASHLGNKPSYIRIMK